MADVVASRVVSQIDSERGVQLKQVEIGRAHV
jgi:hypothetical protein